MDQHTDHLDYPENNLTFLHLYHLGKRSLPTVLVASTIALIAIVMALILIYLLAPSEEVATLRFRLDFQGAERGTYPNGTSFKSSDIVATPILRRVWTENGLQRFVDFETFSTSIFVTESNDALDQLAREYRGKLGDPKLSAVDRERIEREYTLKVQSLSRSEYSLNYATDRGGEDVPAELVSETLNDVLATWAEHTRRERGALKYQVPLFSQNVLPAREFSEAKPLIALDLMRSKIADVIRNIGLLRKIPGADVLRTKGEGISLMEIELSLDDLIRLQIRPLISRIKAAGSLGDRAETIRFLESQLTHNRLRRDEAAARVTTLRDSLSLYRSDQPADRALATAGSSGSSGETVMPQLGESFLDRVVDLASQSADRQYRQEIVDEVTTASLQVIPYETEIAYYEDLLKEIRSAPGGAGREEVAADLAVTYDAFRQAISQIREIYDLISQNLNTSESLYTVRGPVTTFEARGLEKGRLFLLGVLVWMIIVAGILVWAFIRFRIEEEEIAGQLEGAEVRSA